MILRNYFEALNDKNNYVKQSEYAFGQYLHFVSIHILIEKSMYIASEAYIATYY